MHRLTPAVLAFATSLLFVTNALAAQRAFVASYGNDTNAAAGCLLTNPCRTFASAMTQVDAGGEVVALDAGGYGQVTITKSVTITTNPGYFAGIATSAGHGITINGSGIKVVLRGLDINGTGSDAFGIYLPGNASLTIENCIVANFLAGLSVDGPAAVRIIDSVFRANWLSGVQVTGGASATLNNVRITGAANTSSGLVVASDEGVTTTVTVTDSEASGAGIGMTVNAPLTAVARLSVRGSAIVNNVVGLRVAAMTGTASIGHSLVVGNGVGLQNEAGVLETYGDNVLRYNTTPTSGTITPVAGQ